MACSGAWVGPLLQGPPGPGSGLVAAQQCLLPLLEFLCHRPRLSGLSSSLPGLSPFPADHRLSLSLETSVVRDCCSFAKETQVWVEGRGCRQSPT